MDMDEGQSSSDEAPNMEDFHRSDSTDSDTGNLNVSRSSDDSSNVPEARTKPVVKTPEADSVQTQSTNFKLTNNEPKLSFGISQILADVPDKSKQSPELSDATRMMIQAAISKSESDRSVQMAALQYMKTISAAAGGGVSGGGSGTGGLQPGILGTSLQYASYLPGIIKVPAYRLSCGGGGGVSQQSAAGLTAIMFPWMHERKDRMAGRLKRAFHVSRLWCVCHVTHARCLSSRVCRASVARLSRVCRASVARLSRVCRASDACLSRICRVSVARLSCVSVARMSRDCRQMSRDCRVSVAVSVACLVARLSQVYHASVTHQSRVCRAFINAFSREYHANAELMPRKSHANVDIRVNVSRM